MSSRDATSSGHPHRHPDVTWKPIGRTGILLNLRTGDYFELDETATAIWRLLNGRTSVDDVAATLARKHGADARRVRRDVGAFVRSLARRKLILEGSKSAVRQRASRR